MAALSSSIVTCFVAVRALSTISFTGVDIHAGWLGAWAPASGATARLRTTTDDTMNFFMTISSLDCVGLCAKAAARWMQEP